MRYSETTDITDSNFANMMKESPSASSNFVWTCVSTNETPPTTIGSYSCEQYKHPVNISKIYFYHENTENGQYEYLRPPQNFTSSNLLQTKKYYTLNFSSTTFTSPITHIRFVANPALTGDSISVENISQHEIQLETGAVPTDYEPYYEDGFRVSNWVGTYIDNKQEDSSMFGDYLWSLSAEYVSDNVSENMAGLESRISSNEEYLLGPDKSSGLVGQSKNINTFFEFDTSENGYLKIGKKTGEQTEDPFYLKIKNNRISFYGSDNQNVIEDTLEDGEVAFISSKKMYITEAEVLSSIEVGTNLTEGSEIVPVLRVGNYEFVPRTSGNLSIRLFKKRRWNNWLLHTKQKRAVIHTSMPNLQTVIKTSEYTLHTKLLKAQQTIRQPFRWKWGYILLPNGPNKHGLPEEH